jgi:P-type Cu+ transporter
VDVLEPKPGIMTLDVEGMTCINCSLGITRYLEDMGLKDVKVDFLTGSVIFQQTEALKTNSIIEGIQKLGYTARVSESTASDQKRKKLTTIEKKFLFSLFFTVPLLLHMVLSINILHNAVFQMAVCLPVYILGVMHFGRSAWSSMKTGVPNMDVLIFIGTSAAFFYSVAGTFIYFDNHELQTRYLFFETSATIITLVLLGNLMEHKAVTKTTSAIAELNKLKPEKAKLYIKGQKPEVQEVSVASIQKNDILVINTGDKIPLDGVIVYGVGLVDESMISGESLPVGKKTDDELIGGTVLIDGSIRIKVIRTGGDTTLSKIIEMVSEAHSKKPEIQKIGDKVSGIFVPVVLGIALLTFLISALIFDIELSNALMNSIAVLVIACPCAMGLATPTAVMVGLGIAAREGILVKGGNTIEQLAKIKTIIFDKTGTLTTGNLKISDIDYRGNDPSTIRSLIYKLESHSSHPIAKSMVRELADFSDLSLPVQFIEIEEIKGRGINATDELGNTYKIGSYRMADKTQTGDHDIYLYKNDEMLATIDLHDEIKSDTKSIISQLNQMGIQIIMLSGDRKAKCEKVASLLGIKKYYFDQTPEAKMEIIKKLSELNLTGMVGDGINDAPALALSSVGISLGNATQVAIQSSQVILMNEKELAPLIRAVKIGKHTLLTIKQNLFWAFFYNVLAIPVAAAGFLNPMIAALSMAFSDVIVIGNSLRLRIKKIH